MSRLPVSRRHVLGACVIAALSAGLACDDAAQPGPSSARPVLGALTERTILDERRVTVTLTWELGAPVRAPAWSGIVTALPHAAGETLETGDVAAEVSGISRIAAATPSPFYRPLRTGDAGDDVAQLNTLLAGLGHFDPALAASADDTYTAETAAAVGRLAAAIGASGAAFDPAWVAWLPHDHYRIGEIAFAVGSPAPAPGTEIMREAGVLTSAVLTAANANEALSLDPAADWVAIFREARYGVVVTELSFAPDVLADLAAALPDAPERVDGSVQRAQQLAVFALPSSAVMAGETGLCIWTLDGSEYRSVPVEALSARAGVTNIARGEGLSLQAAVLANPSQVLEAPQCP